MAEVQPVVSVIIATYNRASLLSRTLDALEQQEDVGPFEVIVVDDGSSDDTDAMLAGRRTCAAYTLRTYRQPANAGPAIARNRGWHAARSDHICFTDDDCRATPRWLANLLTAADATGAGIVQGRTDPDPEQQHAWGVLSRSITVPDETGFYHTCNILYRRDVLEKMSGFDETFRFAYGEDTDLAWRARSAGVTTAFAEDAKVHHEVWPSDALAYIRDMRRSEGLVHLVSKHPGVRAHAGAKVFWRPAHFAAGLVAIGALSITLRSRFRPGWLVLGIALMKYWQESRSDAQRRQAGAPLATWIRLSPITLVSDLYELFVMARASWRYRTLLL
jgi:glycosyltransferase involved in cell wall biosynthesis